MFSVPEAWALNLQKKYLTPAQPIVLESSCIQTPYLSLFLETTRIIQINEASDNNEVDK